MHYPKQEVNIIKKVYWVSFMLKYKQQFKWRERVNWCQNCTLGWLRYLMPDVYIKYKHDYSDHIRMFRTMRDNNTSNTHVR